MREFQRNRRHFMSKNDKYLWGAPGFDQNRDGEISRPEFRQAIESLGLNLVGSSIDELFKVIDITGDGTIEYQEFLAAFKNSNVVYSYDLEKAIMDVSEQCDAIICFIDPKNIRFSIRELSVYEALYVRFGAKMKFFVYLKDLLVKETKLKAYIDACKVDLTKRFRAATFQMGTVFPPKGQKFSGVEGNDIEEVFAFAGAGGVSGNPMLLVDETQQNISQILTELRRNPNAASTAERLARTLRQWVGRINCATAAGSRLSDVCDRSSHASRLPKHCS